MGRGFRDAIQCLANRRILRRVEYAGVDKMPPEKGDRGLTRDRPLAEPAPVAVIEQMVRVADQFALDGLGGASSGRQECMQQLLRPAFVIVRGARCGRTFEPARKERSHAVLYG